MFTRQDTQLLTIGIFSVVACVFIIVAGGRINEHFDSGELKAKACGRA